jgi:hypothetical protein
MHPQQTGECIRTSTRATSRTQLGSPFCCWCCDAVIGAVICDQYQWQSSLFSHRCSHLWQVTCTHFSPSTLWVTVIHGQYQWQSSLTSHRCSHLWQVICTHLAFISFYPALLLVVCWLVPVPPSIYPENLRVQSFFELRGHKLYLSSKMTYVLPPCYWFDLINVWRTTRHFFSKPFLLLIHYQHGASGVSAIAHLADDFKTRVCTSDGISWCDHHTTLLPRYSNCSTNMILYCCKLFC